MFALFQVNVDGTCEFLRVANSEDTAAIVGKSLSVSTGLPILAVSNLANGDTSVQYRFERGKSVVGRAAAASRLSA